MTAAEPSSPRQQLAALLSQCPHIYTVDNYGGVGPGSESVEAYALPDGAADWLLAHGVRLAPPGRYVLPDNHPAKEGFRAYEDGIADGLAPEDAARMGIGVALALTAAPPDQARREGPRPWPTLYAHPGVPIGEVWYASDEHLQKFRWAKDGEGVLTLIEYDRVGRADEEPR